MSCSVFVAGFAGLEGFKLDVPLSMCISQMKQDIYDKIPESIRQRVGISTAGGLSIDGFNTVGDMCEDSDIRFVNLRLSACLCGGKGGFNELLKQRARKISKKKKENSSKDLYKTLDGRRVKNIKKLKQLEKYIDTLDEKEKAQMKEKREKLEKILSVNLESTVKYEDMDFLDDVEKQIQEIRGIVNYKESESETEESETEESEIEESKSGESENEEKESKKSCKFDNFFNE